MFVKAMIDKIYDCAIVLLLLALCIPTAVWENGLFTAHMFKSPIVNKIVLVY